MLSVNARLSDLSPLQHYGLFRCCCSVGLWYSQLLRYVPKLSTSYYLPMGWWHYHWLNDVHLYVCECCPHYNVASNDDGDGCDDDGDDDAYGDDDDDCVGCHHRP